ncbi:MAG: amino acid permease [Desulfobacteraceae bacterium]
MKHHGESNQTLPREIGPFSATALVIANMVGTGIFTTTGLIMAELGSAAALLLSWLLGGLFALCGALCYAELGARHPRAGGEYVYLKHAFGRWMGFLSGWISLVVGFSAPIAAAAMAFAAYVTGLGASGNGPFWILRIFGVPLVTISLQTTLACAAILCFTLLHCLSITIGTRVQNYLTLLKVGLILFFVFAALLFGNGHSHMFSITLQWSDLISEKTAVALIFVSFAYSGWNGAAYLGEEIRSPHRNLPLALITGTLVVTLLYMALNIVFLYALPSAAMSGTIDVGTKAAKTLFGAAAGRWVGGAIAVGLLSVLSAMIMTGPRVYFAMARDRVFFEKFGHVSRQHRTPAASIFLQAGLAMMMVITATFDQLLIYIGFTLSLSALMTVAGLIRLRHRRPDVRTTYRTPGYPVTPLIFIIGNVWIIFYALKSRPIASLAGLATIGIGLAAYLAFCRKRGATA